MAFGNVKGSLSGQATSVSTALAISTGGPITVVVGDLIYAVLAEQASITSTACNDNLGNVYVPLSGGVDAGTTVTGRAWYSRVSVAGSLTSVTFTTNGGANNAVGLATVIEGPFQDPSLSRQTLDSAHTSAANLTFDTGNRRVVAKSNFGATRALIPKSSGKYYCEFTMTQGHAQDSVAFGVANGSFPFDAGWVQGTSFLGRDNNGIGWGYLDSGAVFLNGANVNPVPCFLQGDVGCMAVDIGLGLIWFRTNGNNWNNSGVANPATGVGGINIAVLGTPIYPAVENDLAGDIVTCNFGTSAYAQTPPAGFGNWDTLLDANPAGIINDNVTPYVCPATGTMLQGQEVILSFAVHNGSVTFSGQTNTKIIQLNTQTVLTAAIGLLITSNTTSVAPSWLSSATPSESAYGTTSFKQELTQTLSAFKLLDTDILNGPVVGISTPAGISFYSTLSDPQYRYRFRPEPSVITQFIPPRVAPVSIAYSMGSSPQYRYRFGPEAQVIFTPAQQLTGFQLLTPGLFSDTDALFAPSTVRGITPSLLVDNDAFSSPSLTTAYQINTFSFSDSDNFFDPQIIRSTWIISPSLISDGDSLFSPSAISSYTLSLNLTVDNDSFSAISLQGNVSPGIISDVDHFYAPNVVGGVAYSGSIEYGLKSSQLIIRSEFIPPMSLSVVIRIPAPVETPVSYVTSSPLIRRLKFNEAAVIEAARMVGGVGASLFVDTDTFFAPLVVASINLTPTLFVDADVLFSPFVANVISPAQIVDTDTFFAPQQASTYTVTPGLFVDQDIFSFYTPSVVSYITPVMFADSDVFFAPGISSGLVTIDPARIVDSDLLFTPSIANAGVDKSIVPALFIDTDTFFAPTLTVGAVTVQSSKFTDVDTFFAPSVSSVAMLTPNKFTDADSIFSPSISVVNILTPAIFTDADTLFSPLVLPGLVTITPNKLIDTDIFFSPIRVSPVVAPNKFTDSDTFFSPVLSVGAAPIAPSLLVDTTTFFAPQIALAKQQIFAGFLADSDSLFQPSIFFGVPPYEYPVGHSLDSDYGIRRSRLRRGRLVIGRR